MNRRELLRSTLFAAAAATTATPARAREFPANYDESKELARADWKPVFFSDHQNETVVVLSDLIIPETDTPGAKAAQVNRFLDLLLSAETREAQQSFLNSLSYIDGEARSRYGDAFVHIPQDSQVELLHFLSYPHSMQTWGEKHDADESGHRHFENIKGWIARIFFTSEGGMKALGWNGEPPHGELTGCEVEATQKKAPSRAN